MELLDLMICEQAQCWGCCGKMEGVCCLVTVVETGIVKLAAILLLGFEGQTPIDHSYSNYIITEKNNTTVNDTSNLFEHIQPKLTLRSLNYLNPLTCFILHSSVSQSLLFPVPCFCLNLFPDRKLLELMWQIC